MDTNLPDDNSAVALDPQGDSATPPEQQPGPSYAALDALIPDAEDFDETLRGKPIAEINRIVKQWRGEVAGANKTNRDAAQAQLDLAKTLLELRRQEAPPPPRQRAPRIFAEDEQGQAVAAPLDELLDQRLQPMAAHLQSLTEKLQWNGYESARIEAGTTLGVDRKTWDSLRPQLGMFLSVNKHLDPSDPQSWVHVAELVRGGGAALAKPKASIPVMPAAPVGNATSHPAARQQATRRLSESELRHVDEIASMSGIDRSTAQGQRTYKKLLADVAAGEANV